MSRQLSSSPGRSMPSQKLRVPSSTACSRLAILTEQAVAAASAVLQDGNASVALQRRVNGIGGGAQLLIAGEEHQRAASIGARRGDDGLLHRLLVVGLVRERHVAGQIEQDVPFVIERAVDGGDLDVPQPEAVAEVAKAGAGAQRGAGEDGRPAAAHQAGFDQILHRNGCDRQHHRLALGYFQPGHLSFALTVRGQKNLIQAVVEFVERALGGQYVGKERHGGVVLRPARLGQRGASKATTSTRWVSCLATGIPLDLDAAPEGLAARRSIEPQSLRIAGVAAHLVVLPGEGA